MKYEEMALMGIEGLKVHKLRSVLTMLGIIFGVGAVIAMLSIGEGAKRAALEKYNFLGVNNIIVRDKNLSDEELEEVRAKFSAGLSLKDANAIKNIVPSVESVAPQVELELEAKFEDKSVKSTIVGVTSAYSDILNYTPELGDFLSPEDHERNLRVCVLGSEVARKLFPVDSPLGQRIKIADQWFEVCGVMSSKTLFTETVGELAARNLNQDIYIPFSAFTYRFEKDNVLASEVDQLTIRIDETNRLIESASIIRRILDRRHHENDDYDLVIPYELLKQEEKEREIYNMVLGSIAAISLLVGGIGIMNIMLATVLERTREIGIRRSLGARKREILLQFLIEATGLSLVGGILGVILGAVLSGVINSIAEFETVITLFSVFIAFFVSAAIGVVFGTFPAKRAAEINPIDALRYE
jgi:putative ABC transport system permease protein